MIGKRTSSLGINHQKYSLTSKAIDHFYNVFSLFYPDNTNFQIFVIDFVVNSVLFNPIDNGFDVFVNQHNQEGLQIQARSLSVEWSQPFLFFKLRIAQMFVCDLFVVHIPMRRVKSREPRARFLHKMKKTQAQNHRVHGTQFPQDSFFDLFYASNTLALSTNPEKKKNELQLLTWKRIALICRSF